MSKKIKQLANRILVRGARFGRKEDELFSGSSSSSSRREEIMKDLPPDLQGRSVAFQRNEVNDTSLFITIFNSNITTM